MSITTGSKEFFPGIGKIKYEGPQSDNPLAYKWYDENRIVGGKTMKEFLRFAVCYWHTFCNTGADPFGPGTKHFPWDVSNDAVQRAKDKMDAAFEFITKLVFRIIVFMISTLLMKEALSRNMKAGCKRWLITPSKNNLPAA